MHDPDPGPRPTGCPEPVGVQLVPLRRRHLRAVARIEAQVYPRPWSTSLFLSELSLRAGRYYLAARVQAAVVGYAGLMLLADEGHVTTIAVHPAWHRHQIGTRLLLQLTRHALDRGARHLTLEVRESNVAAQAMYAKFGMVAAGIRKNYYAETREDALVMWAHDIDTGEYGRRLEAIAAGVAGPTVVEEGR
ncbi:MAG: ribosomal protein S18-alanine N-acetyltransferase [Acidimicrobiales bacterium]